MAKNEYEYIKKLANDISVAFDSQKYSNSGRIEVMDNDIDLLKQGVSIILALLINHCNITERQIMDLLTNGFFIKRG